MILPPERCVGGPRPPCLEVPSHPNPVTAKPPLPNRRDGPPQCNGGTGVGGDGARCVPGHPAVPHRLHHNGCGLKARGRRPSCSGREAVLYNQNGGHGLERRLAHASEVRGRGIAHWYKGLWRGRVALRKTGYFDIDDGTGKRIGQGISAKYCRLLPRVNGWQQERISADAGAALPPHGYIQGLARGNFGERVDHGDHDAVFMCWRREEAVFPPA